MEYSRQFLEYLADFICGDKTDKYPEYRSSSGLTNFFQNIGINVVHDGSTRKYLVWNELKKLSQDKIELLVKTLVSPRLYFDNKDGLKLAIKSMNDLLQYENKKIKFEGQTPTIIDNESTMEDLLNEKPLEPQQLVSQNSGDFSPNTTIFGNNNQVHIHIGPQDAKISLLFNELTNMAKTIQQKTDILLSIQEMQNTINTPTFKDKYKNFMASIADHMAIFLPLITQLSQYL